MWKGGNLTCAFETHWQAEAAEFAAETTVVRIRSGVRRNRPQTPNQSDGLDSDGLPVGTREKTCKERNESHFLHNLIHHHTEFVPGKDVSDEGEEDDDDCEPIKDDDGDDDDTDDGDDDEGDNIEDACNDCDDVGKDADKDACDDCENADDDACDDVGE